MGVRYFVSNRVNRNSGFGLVELFVVLALIALLISLFLPAVRNVGPVARRMQCKNNLRSIAIALRTYHTTHGSYPPAYTVDATGRRLHSWRTLILPQLGHKTLYEQIDLSKPWDAPANRKAYRMSLNEYHCPMTQCPENHTTYLAVVTPGSCLQPEQGRSIDEFASDEGEKLLLIEVGSRHAVHWMSPMDADEQMVLGDESEEDLPHNAGRHVALMDGRARFLSASTTPEELRALISFKAKSE